MRPYLNISLGVPFILAICLIGQAQSGRRSPKPLSPPTNTPSPAESEQPPPSGNKPAIKPQKLVVGMDDSSASSYIPQYISDEVWRGFIGRLNGISSVTLTTDRNMRRKQAIDRAKKETESFVVLLQLGTDNIGAGVGPGQINSSDDLVITYVIFSPGTGKAKDQGRVYVHPSRSVLGQRLPTGRPGESQLNEAGREIASRVMSALDSESPTIMR